MANTLTDITVEQDTEPAPPRGLRFYGNKRDGHSVEWGASSGVHVKTRGSRVWVARYTGQLPPGVFTGSVRMYGVELSGAWETRREAAEAGIAAYEAAKLTKDSERAASRRRTGG